jgi:hypothetical protein
VGTVGGGGVKRPGREINYLSVSSAEVKNEWSYTSASGLVFVASRGAAVPFVLSRIAVLLYKREQQKVWKLAHCGGDVVCAVDQISVL